MRVKTVLIRVLVVAMLSAGNVLAQEPPPPTFVVEQFVVTGENPLDAALTNETLAPFTGEHAGMDGLLAARDALDSRLKAAGHTFHRVVLPAQTLESGIVTLNLVAFALGEVAIKGNRFFSNASIQRSLPSLTAGTQPQVRELSRELAVANLHPAKSLKVRFRASELHAQALDANVEVQDSKPWSVFAGLNNIGNKNTGHTRMAVGGQYSNVSGHDDILTGSFTTSPDNADDVQQYGGFYQLPVYALHGWLTAFYVKSDVDVGNVQGLFDVSGSGDFVGLSFKHQLISVGRYRQSFTVGLQDRSFDTAINNALTGTRIRAISSQVRSRPFSARYDGGYNWRTTSLDFYVDFTHNLSFGGHNRAVDYRSVRQNAEPDWKVFRFGALVTQRLPRGYHGVFKLTAQHSNEPLIPGEQIGFGGDRSVRGFQQRTISGDRGAQFNLEVWSPPVPRLYGVRFLAFVDAAHKVLEQPVVGQRPNDTISSVGIGARWQWQKQLFASLDYGQPLAQADGEASDRGTSKVHFNLEYRY